MTRGSFFKSLLAVIAAPKILAEVNFSTSIIGASIANVGNSALFQDLQLLTPHYYKSYIEKYGSDNYAMIKEILGDTNGFVLTKNYYHHED
jgi:hypothetical protein